MPATAPIDHARALARLGGNQSLHRRVLAGFADSYGSGLAAWQDLLDEGAWGELRRHAHTLQGLAGTIGADSLRERALALEVAATAQQSVAARESLSGVREHLGVVIADARERAELEPEARVFVPNGDMRAPAAAGPRRDAWPSDVLPCVSELRGALQANDKGAISAWTRHGDVIVQAMSGSRGRRLRLAMERLDFDSAFDALSQPA